MTRHLKTRVEMDRPRPSTPSPARVTPRSPWLTDLADGVLTFGVGFVTFLLILLVFGA